MSSGPLSRAFAWMMVALLAWPPPASAQLLPALGSTLQSTLNTVQQTVSDNSLLGPILGPILDPLLGLVIDTLDDLPLLNQQKLDTALRHWASTGSVDSPSTARVIISVAPGQRGLVSGLSGALGALLRLELAGINALVADVNLTTLLTLALDPRVTSISIDAPVLSIDGNLIAPADGASDTDAPLRATLGLATTTPAAAGIGVAVIDSGIAPSSDFAGRISAFYDFTRGGVASAPIDAYGHGTHVAGIIGSSGASSSNAKYRGLGASARLIGLRVLDANGAGQTSQVIQAIEFATAQRTALGIHVINLSLGHPIYESATTDPLVRAVERAVTAGIVVVTAAGNYGFNSDAGQSGYAGITSPGNAPSAITVGALRAAGTIDRGDDQPAPYSSRGPSWYDAIAKPDLLAPGHGITSNAVPGSGLYAAYPSVRAGTSHMRLNGTSMSAATASGAAALVLEAHRQTHLLGPALSSNVVKAILQYTATPLNGIDGAAAPDALVQGAGALNVPAALAVARGIDASRPVGADWMSGSVAPWSTYADVVWPWARFVTWHDTRLSGQLLEFHRPAWDRTTSWGELVTWESDLVIGQNVVWDHAIDWASNIVWGSELVGSATSTDGSTFVWGYAGDPASTRWGDLSTAPTGGTTFVWGYTDASTASPSQP